MDGNPETEDKALKLLKQFGLKADMTAEQVIEIWRQIEERNRKRPALENLWAQLALCHILKTKDYNYYRGAWIHE